MLKCLVVQAKIHGLCTVFFESSLVPCHQFLKIVSPKYRCKLLKSKVGDGIKHLKQKDIDCGIFLIKYCS